MWFSAGDLVDSLNGDGADALDEARNIAGWYATLYFCINGNIHIAPFVQVRGCCAYEMRQSGKFRDPNVPCLKLNLRRLPELSLLLIVKLP